MSDTAQTDDGGIFGRFMTRLFGRSYRTGALGFFSLIVTVLSMMPDLPPGVTKYVTAAVQAMVALGLMTAKDGKVTGLPNQQPGVK